MLDPDNLSTNGLLVIYVLFLSVFVQEQAGHPNGSWSDWCHGIMLIDFMVAYPGRRDEVQMRFTDVGQSQPAWTYFISWPTPLRSLHGLVFHPPTHLAGWSGLKAGRLSASTATLAWARSFCFHVWCLMQGSVGLDPHSPASSVWPLCSDMEGLQARELPVASDCHSVHAGAWSRWYEPHAPSASHFSFFLIVSEDYLLWNTIQA